MRCCLKVFAADLRGKRTVKTRRRNCADIALESIFRAKFTGARDRIQTRASHWTAHPPPATADVRHRRSHTHSLFSASVGAESETASSSHITSSHQNAKRRVPPVVMPGRPRLLHIFRAAQRNRPIPSVLCLLRYKDAFRSYHRFKSFLMKFQGLADFCSLLAHP
jgi:hypothetical protein